VLREWRDRLIAETGDGWPEKVTAFREGMAVHGRFRQPCPDCGTPVQRIVRAENECNLLRSLQTGGRVLADRALSRLLGKDWPRSSMTVGAGLCAGPKRAPSMTCRGGLCAAETRSLDDL